MTSVEEALFAQRAGVDTVEVCSWLASGGVTPSFGLLNVLQEQCPIRKRVLVRPTPGGFQYTDVERQVLLRDMMIAGVGDPHCGIVSGGLDAQGDPDVGLVKAMLLASAGREFTFHRALDLCTDPLRGFELLMAMHVPRVLTSGGCSKAIEGAGTLAEFVRRADARVAVAAAGGITPETVVELVERTGVQEVHFAAQRELPHAPQVALSTAPPAAGLFTTPDEAKIEGVLNALAKAGLR